MNVRKTQVNKATRKEAPGRRFAEPFGSLLWHVDGTPFTNQEYRDAGFSPPTQRMLRAFAKQKDEGLR